MVYARALWAFVEYYDMHAALHWADNNINHTINLNSLVYHDDCLEWVNGSAEAIAALQWRYSYALPPDQNHECLCNVHDHKLQDF